MPCPLAIQLCSWRWIFGGLLMIFLHYGMIVVHSSITFPSRRTLRVSVPPSFSLLRLA